MENQITKGKFEVDDKNVFVGEKLMVTCWFTEKIDETRLEGESWLDMRERTKEHRIRTTEIEPHNNAILVAETFNVTQETGKTPRQLADENKMLLEALKDCLEGVKELQSDYQDGWRPNIKKATEAINKATK